MGAEGVQASRIRVSGSRWMVGTVLLAVFAAIVAGWVARERTLTQLSQRTAAEATLRAALLDSEIARYRLLPLALRDDRDVVAALEGQVAAAAALNRKLEALAQTTGAPVIYVIGTSGTAIAASNWRTPTSFVGRDYRFRRYVRDARRMGAAEQFARGTVSGHAGLFLSRRTANDGVIVVKLEFDRIERDWARAGGDTIVRDADGMVVVSSRPERVFATTRPLNPERLAAIRRESSLPRAAMRPLSLPAGLIERSVGTTQPGWTLTQQRTATAALRSAMLAIGGGAGLAVAMLGALGWSLRQRTLLGRQRTAELETAVAARTAELTREIDERAASEARAAELREGLRQANRLATLGQVTASVAHETAQPVAAIRNYAMASTLLLDRGETNAVRRNLDAIARLSDRIGTVTSELRGFARRGTGTVRAVPLIEVVDGALLILREQLRRVTLDRVAIDPALSVRGGRVRLEQVLVNLLQNAIEALRDRPDPRLTMTLFRDGDRVILTIADNGPGIAPDLAPRLFTPFVTSRPEGLGLGLVIAHDIMVDFGGTLRLVPGDTGGARFEIVMVSA